MTRERISVNTLLPGKVSRRQFLQLSGATLLSITVVACGLEPTTEPTPKITLTNTPKPIDTLVPTETLTPTNTPEPLKLVEAPDIKIPGVEIKKYQVDDVDILNGNKLFAHVPTPNYGVKPAYTLDYTIEPTSLLERYIGKDDWFAINDMDRGLNKEWLLFYIRNGYACSESRYFLNPKKTEDDYNNINSKAKEVAVLSNLRQHTMTVFMFSSLLTRDNIWSDWQIDEVPIVNSRITDSGNMLYLSFPIKDPLGRKLYLIDLSTEKVSRTFSDENFENHNDTYFSADGSRLWNGDAYVFDIDTGKKTKINWPTILSVAGIGGFTSPDLNFITRMVGMFPSDTTVEGQWGTYVFTPIGFFLISAEGRNIIVDNISDEGIFTTYKWNDVFVFKNGEYQLLKSGDGKPLNISAGFLGTNQS